MGTLNKTRRVTALDEKSLPTTLKRSTQRCLYAKDYRKAKVRSTSRAIQALKHLVGSGYRISREQAIGLIAAISRDPNPSLSRPDVESVAHLFVEWVVPSKGDKRTFTELLGVARSLSDGEAPVAVRPDSSKIVRQYKNGFVFTSEKVGSKQVNLQLRGSRQGDILFVISLMPSGREAKGVWAVRGAIEPYLPYLEDLIRTDVLRGNKVTDSVLSKSTKEASMYSQELHGIFSRVRLDKLYMLEKLGQLWQQLRTAERVMGIEDKITKTHGKLTKRVLNKGSKAERAYPILALDEDSFVVINIDGENSYNSPTVDSYLGQHVEVKGKWHRGTLRVPKNSIRVMKAPPPGGENPEETTMRFTLGAPPKPRSTGRPEWSTLEHAFKVLNKKPDRKPPRPVSGRRSKPRDQSRPTGNISPLARAQRLLKDRGYDFSPGK